MSPRDPKKHWKDPVEGEKKKMTKAKTHASETTGF